MVSGSTFISYTGALEQLGQSQVLPYLRGIARHLPVNLISFEKTADFQDVASVEHLRSDLNKQGVRWRPYQYRRSRFGRVVNYLQGVASAAQLTNSDHVLHARSHVAAAMGLAVRRLTRCRLLFDLRGELADEYADIGHWSRRSLVYRATKRLEGHLLRHADGVVVLTEALASELRVSSSARLCVIPCCVDLELFRATAPPSVRAPHVLVYSGSLGTWYLLPEMIEFFRQAQAEIAGLRLKLITQSNTAALAANLARAGIRREDVSVEASQYREMPQKLAGASAGMAFIRPIAAKRGSSPTKIAEYLAMGLPVIANAGVGDLKTHLPTRGVGYVLDDFTEPSMRAGVAFLKNALQDPTMPSRCRVAAREVYDLDRVGVARYLDMYHLLGS